MQNQELYARVETLKIARDIMLSNRENASRAAMQDSSVGGESVKAPKPISAQQVRQVADTLWGFAMPEGSELDCGCGKGEKHPQQPNHKVTVLPFAWVRDSSPGIHKKFILMVGTLKFATIEADGEVSCTLTLNLPGAVSQVIVGKVEKAMKVAVGKLHEWTLHHPASVDEIVAAMERAARGD